MRAFVTHRLGRLVAVPLLRQGPHTDPADPGAPAPDRSHWQRWQVESFESAEMVLFRGVIAPTGDARRAVLAELAEYHGVDEATALHRALHWEQWSSREWQEAGDVGEFYRQVESWAYDLLWYAYLQVEGYGVPESVVALRAIQGRTAGHRHLDLGSGVGVTSHLFAKAGYQTDLADVSPTLLAFARWRMERHGVAAGFIDLNDDELPSDAYDVVTAIDVLAHVPDLPSSLASLHRAMRPDGLLITNFDARPPSPENAWHLYETAAPMRAAVLKAGFAPAGAYGNLHRYRRIEGDGGRARALRLAATALLDNPGRERLDGLRGRLATAWQRRSGAS